MKKLSMRSAFAILGFGALVACSGGGTTPSYGAGDPVAPGAAGTGTPGTGGTPVVGTGGTTSLPPGSSVVPDTAIPPAGFDEGGLFGFEQAVAYDYLDNNPSTGGEGGDGDGPPGDGNVATSMIGGSVSGTAIFTQTGIDVAVVIELNNCPAGAHPIRIHGGFSCDNDSTIEGVWDGERGAGIGGMESVIMCDGSNGSLTYTRPGDNPALNWTVGDHNLDTDVTAHVIIISEVDNLGQRVACGNFF
jgi:hypothetical protein